MRGWFALAIVGALLASEGGFAQSPLEELERRLESGRLTPREPGYLGLTADDAGGRGLRVVAVRPGGPADTAGLRVGDVLVEMERRPLRTLDDMGDILRFRAAGQSVALTFDREGVRHVVTARLTGRPVATKEPAPGEEPAPIIEEILPPPAEDAPSPAAPPASASPREEIESLVREAAELRRRLETLERRLTVLQERLKAEEAEDRP